MPTVTLYYVEPLVYVFLAWVAFLLIRMIIKMFLPG
jgi:hypothetical protein